MSEDKKLQLKRSLFERGLLAVLLLLAGAVIFYVVNQEVRDYLRPPYDCLFHQLTGLFCPACGATRAMLHLLNLNLKPALKSNALAVFLLPLFVYALFLIFRALFFKGYSLDKIRVAPSFIWLLFALVMVFWLVRNLPGFAFLRPF